MIIDNFQEVQEKESFQAFLHFINEYLSKGHVIILGRDNIVTPTLQPKHIDLHGLGEKSLLHAKKLLEHSYPNKKDIPDETLLKICAQFKGYPLAVDLAVYLLSENVPADRILEVAVEEAKKPGANNEKISERLLNEIFIRTDASVEEKEFLKLFSVYRGKIQEEAIKAIMPEDIFNQAARLLGKRNLLESDGVYYELHPLIREFCYEQLKDKKSIHLKAAHYYVKKRTEHLSPDLEEKIFFNLSKANEWKSIKEAIVSKGRNFIRQGYLDRLQQMINECKEHAQLEPVFYIYEGDITEIRSEWDKALKLFEEARKTDDQEVKIEGLIKYGEILYRKGDVKDSQKYFKEAIELTSINNLKKLYARALNDLGLVLEFFGDYKSSLKHLEDALELRRGLGDKEDIAATLNNIGNIYISQEEFSNGIHFYKQSLKEYQEINDTGQIIALNNLGNAMNKWNKKDVNNYSHQALVISEKIGNKSGIARSVLNIGSSKSNAGDKQCAIKEYEKSLEIYKEIGVLPGISDALNSIGVVKQDLRDKEGALICYQESLKIDQGIGRKSNVAMLFNNIGSLLYENGGNLSEAVLYLLKSIGTYTQIGDRGAKSPKSWIITIRKKNW